VLKDRGVRKNAFFVFRTSAFYCQLFWRENAFFIFGGLAMVDSKDEKWLEKALKNCFSNSNGKSDKDAKLLEGFSMLVLNIAKNLQDDLAEAKALWQREPASRELKEKFDSLARRLFYLERYCREKIEHELS